MPQIYETINLFNKRNGIYPYRYIGSDQYDRNDYFGSSADLLKDLKALGQDQFQKNILQYFDSIDNKQLRQKEAALLKKNNVKKSEQYYNKSDIYGPGSGVKGMKHKKPKIVSDAWRESKKGWFPPDTTREIWKEQRKGRIVSEVTKQKMSQKTSGENNPNALMWKVIDPNGVEHIVKGLRSWCNKNAYNYNRVYHKKDGFNLIKFGTGKGGPGYVNK